jgi:lipid-binding SYLF domain-containing protein
MVQRGRRHKVQWFGVVSLREHRSVVGKGFPMGSAQWFRCITALLVASHAAHSSAQPSNDEMYASNDPLTPSLGLNLQDQDTESFYDLDGSDGAARRRRRAEVAALRGAQPAIRVGCQIGLSTRENHMKTSSRLLVSAAFLLSSVAALADSFSDTIDLFRNAGESAAFFQNSYGYAVFPTVGKGGLVVGGAHGSGRVYRQGTYSGDTKMTQVSVGLQAGGQAYSQMIFFEDQRAYDEFTRGNFEMSADVGATAITASASARTGTTGAGAAASGGKKDAKTAGGYHKGLAVFTIAKGGAMAEVSVAGQKFSFKPVNP